MLERLGIHYFSETRDRIYWPMIYNIKSPIGKELIIEKGYKQVLRFNDGTFEAGSWLSSWHKNKKNEIIEIRVYDSFKKLNSDLQAAVVAETLR